MRTFRFAAAAAALVILLSGCSGGSKAKKVTEKQDRPDYESDELQFQGPEDGDTIAIFDTSMGEIRAVLYPDLAPMAVDNFTGLAEDEYYDGQIFQRVIYGFVAQAGDDSGTGLSGASIWHNNPYPIETTDELHHYSGALCMAHSGDEDESDTCLSQFYFVQSLPTLDKDLQSTLEESSYRQEVKDAYEAVGGLPYLDYEYTVFGQIYEGMEVLDEIGAAETDENDRPVTDITINSVKIDEYEE